MESLKIPEKIIVVAEGEGLSEEDLRNLLSGAESLPSDLADVLEKISDLTTANTGEG